MNSVQFKNLDLNLFRVLLALLEHRSVSRTAEELALTPSAISHALGRLRTALGDPLFERRGGGLTPTAYAVEVGRRVRPSMDRLRDALNRDEFDPATAEREFVIAAGSYVTAVVLPRVVNQLAKIAPGIRLRVRRLEDQSADEVEYGRLDLLFSAPAPVSGRLEWRPIMTDRMVWVARRNHPLIHDPLTMEMLAEARHIIIEKFNRVISSGYPELRRFFDESRELGDVSRAAAGQGRKRGPGPATATIVTDTMHAIAIVAQSDHVTLTLKGLAESFLTEQIQILEPPHPTPLIEIGAIYNIDRARDPGVRWLLEMLTSVADARNKTPGALRSVS
jgi:DNA-binding transcriptional LysR family regulator